MVQKELFMLRYLDKEGNESACGKKADRRANFLRRRQVIKGRAIKIHIQKKCHTEPVMLSAVGAQSKYQTTNPNLKSRKNYARHQPSKKKRTQTVQQSIFRPCKIWF